MIFNDLILEKEGMIKGPFGSAVKKSLFIPKSNGAYKVYEQGVVANNNFSLGSYYLPKSYVENSLERFIIKPGDILMTGAGTLGLLAIAPDNIEKGIMNQALIRIRLNEKIIYKPYFMYYFPWAIRSIACRINGDSVIPNLPPLEVLKRIEVNIPDIEEQKKIADQLDIIKAKISNNNTIASKLEAMAKLIYDYWFVQFDFPDENGRPYKSSGGKMVWNEELKREIPEGWDVTSLENAFDITMGSSPSGDSYNTNKIGIEFYQGATDFGKFFPTERVYTTSPVRFAKAQDILLSVRAPVGTMNIAMNDCCIGRGVAAIHHVSSLYAWNTLLTFKNFFDSFNSNGTTFGALTSADLKNQPTINPPDRILAHYAQLTDPIGEKLRSLSIENQQLSSLRDFLLILPPIETAPPLRQNCLGGERWKMSKIRSVGRQSAKVR